jgi:hypothetical protein
MVVPVRHRQIAATRNSGARAARGERLFFVDADTTINPLAVAAALRWMDKGAVGGGASAWLEGPVPLYGHLIALLCVLIAKLAGFTGGAFMFCTREAFHATGGFNERFYWAEEGGFALALKREGRFVVLWKSVLTSGRRLRTVSGLRLLAFFGRALLSPFKMVTRRSSAEKIWYGSNRANDDTMSTSPAVRVSNAVALLILIVLLTAPLLRFVPQSLTPLSTPVGQIRFVVRIFLCHLGLFFWPVAIVLLVNLMRQRRWTGLFQSVLLIAFCFWQAWSATRGILWFWTWFYHWLTP